jgi:type IV secretion system protein VirD4
VLIIMDEFPILGYMEAVEKASGLVAGFGVRLWPIIQDLSQLQALYEKSWETFVGNAGLLQFFGNSDLTTLKYISDRLGESTVITEGGSKGEVSVAQAAAGFTGESGSINTNFVPLMNAEEVSRYFSRQSKRQLIFWPGSNPIALDRLIYYSDTHFEGQWDKRKDT